MMPAMIVEKMKSIMRRRTFLEGIVMNDLELDSASGARAQVQRNRLQVFFTKIRAVIKKTVFLRSG